MSRKTRSAQTSYLPAAIIVLVVSLLSGSFFYLGRSTSNVKGVTSTVPATTFYFTPTSQTVPVGSTFKEIVTIDTGTNQINSVNIAATYDPAFFEVVSFQVNPGNLLFPSAGPSSINNTTGVAMLGLVSSVGVSGRADVAVLTLREKQAFAVGQRIAFGADSSARLTGSTLNMLIGTVPTTIYSGPALPVATPSSTPRPTPTIASCANPMVAKFSVDWSCGTTTTNAFRAMDVTCANGYTEHNEGSTTCKTIDVWALYATDVCKLHATCNAPTPTPIAASCIGQCKGDVAGTSYPSGRACIGMDNLCYLCLNGRFSVSQTACAPTPTRSPTPMVKLIPTATPFYKIYTPAPIPSGVQKTTF